MVVDDHAVVRTGVATMLLAFNDLSLAGEAASGAEAIEMATQLQPDVILMDLMMPDTDGVAATRAIKKRVPTAGIVALTSFREDRMVQEALKAGAVSYLLKDVSAAQLAETIRAAHAGRPTLAPEAVEALIRASQSPPIGHDLTDRERLVLKLMMEGLSNAEIAERLVVSLSTAKFHASSVLSKLGVSSRLEAVTLALKHHLVS